MHNKGMHMLAVTLIAIGGLNWLLVGLFSWDIGQIFGGMDTAISRIIYVLVGAATVYLIASHKSTCKACSGMGNSGMPNMPK